MPRKLFLRLVLAVFLLTGFAPSALADPIEPVVAYIYPGMIVQFNGQTLSFIKNDEELPPIVYEGVTYLPAIKLAKKFGVDAQWDKNTQTLSFGRATEAEDFIDQFIPYSVSNSYDIITSNQYKTEMIAGQEYTHWIKLTSNGTGAYYNLEGKYSTITFSAYNGSIASGTITFTGDNDELLAECTIVGKALPQTFTVDVSNVIQLQIAGHFGEVGWLDFYLVDMTIQ